MCNPVWSQVMFSRPKTLTGSHESLGILSGGMLSLHSTGVCIPARRVLPCGWGHWEREPRSGDCGNTTTTWPAGGKTLDVGESWKQICSKGPIGGPLRETLQPMPVSGGPLKLDCPVPVWMSFSSKTIKARLHYWNRVEIMINETRLHVHSAERERLLITE